ncbi:hypothetical protein [Bifidobacterium biavatii]|nr:hypothetical protein [Bifidobacterium biavatii]
MARKARAWTAVDTEAVRHILRLRDADVRHLSLRAIGTATGISHGRIGDLFNFANGAPSLNEFVSLCLLFNRRPSQVMEEVMRTVESADGSELAALSSGSASDDDAVSERSPDSDEEVAKRALGRLMDLAAKHGDTEAEQEAYEELP